MRIIRRDLLGMCGAMTALPGFTALALAQQAGPKLVQVLRKDLEGQGQVVQETVVSIAEFAPGSAAPWHQHPGAQELLHVIEGGLTIEIDGRAPLRLNAGEAGIIDAELVHLARNETTAAARAVVVHSRAAKDKPLVVVVRK